MNALVDILNNPKAIRVLKGIVFCSLLIFFASLVTYKIPLPVAEDLPRQMANGRDILQGNFDVLDKNVYSYTQPEHYFANHHWLYGVFVYILYTVIGWSGMVVFKVIFILLIFSILFRTALYKADFWLVALCSIPVILMLMGRSALRPELFGYFFIAFYVYLLLRFEENPKSNVLYWLLPMQVIWANFHITFPIGIMLVGGFLLEKIIVDTTTPFFKKWSWIGLKGLLRSLVIKKLLIVLFLLVAVSFINPHGIRGAIYSLGVNTTDGPVVSGEVQRLFSQNDDVPKNNFFPLRLFIPLLIISGVSFAIGYKKKSIFYFLAIAGTALLTFKIVRSFPFFAMFFLLAVPANLDVVFVKIKNYANATLSKVKIRFEIIVTAIILIGLAYALWINFSRPTGDSEPGLGLARSAEGAARFFIDNDLSGPILNDTDIGSYLIWYLYPKEKVFADNRFGDAYSVSFLGDDYKAMFTDEERWKEMLAKYNFNTIFLYQYDFGSGRDFIFRRIIDKEWSFVYGDKYNVILVRNILKNQAVIDKFSIDHTNAQERWRNLTQSSNGGDLVAVGDLFGLMGQVAWARSIFAITVAQNPSWSKIWYIMGKMELTRGDQANSDPALALLFLQQAIDGGWKTPNSYSYLALAYYRLGQTEKAKGAVAKELKLNSKSEDAKTWLETFIKDDALKLNN